MKTHLLQKCATKDPPFPTMTAVGIMFASDWVSKQKDWKAACKEFRTFCTYRISIKAGSETWMAVVPVLKKCPSTTSTPQKISSVRHSSYSSYKIAASPPSPWKSQFSYSDVIKIWIIPKMFMKIHISSPLSKDHMCRHEVMNMLEHMPLVVCFLFGCFIILDLHMRSYEYIVSGIIVKKLSFRTVKYTI